MTSNQIKKISVEHFARDGYDGASLKNIADDVGIKKASIYNHFKGKDELFLELWSDACLVEIKFVMDLIEINQSRPLEKFLHDFLSETIKRYETDVFNKFWIRTAFFPPSHLQETIMRMTYEYLDQLEKLIIPIVKKAIAEGEISATVDDITATSAFLGVLDGILVEMLYGGPERLMKRKNASWHIYWLGLTNNN